MNKSNTNPGKVDGEVIAKAIIAGLAIDAIVMATAVAYHTANRPTSSPVSPVPPTLTAPKSNPVESTLI